MRSLHRGVSLSKDAGAGLFKWAVIFQALLIVPLLMGLGFWQLERKGEKEVLLAQWSAPVEIKNLSDRNLKGFDRVRIEGVLDQQRWFLLDNQIRDGAVGYEVIGVFQPASGSGSWLIALGWTAATADRSRLPEIALPAGMLELTARLDRPSTGLQLVEPVWQNSWPERVQQLELERFEARLEERLSHWLLRPEQEVLTGKSVNWQPVVMPPERHLGYAVQWFGLALAWGLMTVWLWRATGKTEGKHDA